jgi:hypothetical protein
VAAERLWWQVDSGAERQLRLASGRRPWRTTGGLWRWRRSAELVAIGGGGVRSLCRSLWLSVAADPAAAAGAEEDGDAGGGSGSGGGSHRSRGGWRRMVRRMTVVVGCLVHGLVERCVQ